MNVEHSEAFGMWLWQQSVVHRSLFRALYLQQSMRAGYVVGREGEVIGLREMAKVEQMLANSWRNGWVSDHLVAANADRYAGPFNLESEGIDA